MPSASTSVLVTAVSSWPWVKVPLRLTEPVTASLTLATANDALLVIDSAVPFPSVYEALTLIARPTCACVSVKVEVVAPAIAVPPASHW